MNNISGIKPYDPKNLAVWLKDVFLNHITDIDDKTLLTISHEVSKEILRREP